MVVRKIESLLKLSSKVIVKTHNLNYLKHAKMYQHVLPLTTNSTRLDILKHKGPAFWKEMDIELDPIQHQATQIFILTHPRLTLMLHVYFHLWNLDVKHLPIHIYEMGWGHQLQQFCQSLELLYLKSLNADMGLDPFVLMPVLKNPCTIASSNAAYLAIPNFSNAIPEYDVTGKTLQEITLLKLFCSEACSKREQWSQSFAHSVSALDHCGGPSFPHFHNLLCQLALASGKMLVSHQIWINLLLNAKANQRFIYNKWKRILVFLQLTIRHGLFQLARKVFSHGLEIIPSSSNLFTRLTTQHLFGLMVQIEDIAAYQFLRQSFHRDCTRDNCGKPINAKYSYASMLVLIRDMEKCLISLPDEAHRHYFQGYTFLYKTFTKVSDVHDEKDKAWIKLAKTSFELAYLAWEKDSYGAMYIDLHYIKSTLQKENLEEVMIEASFSSLTNMHNNYDAASTCFRIVLLHYYWGNTFLTLSPLSFAETAYNVYSKTTSFVGYRIMLLKTCFRQLEYGLAGHSDREPDFPNIGYMSARNTDLIENAESFWKIEMGELEMSDSHTVLSSRDLLLDNRDCQELFAFGADIIRKLIETRV